MFIVVYTGIFGNREISDDIFSTVEEAEAEVFTLKELCGIKDGEIYELKPIQK